MADYCNAHALFRPGIDSYSKIEIPKIAIANAVLRSRGFVGVPEYKEPSEIVFAPRPPNLEPERPSFVYLMKNERNGLYKIGYSRNPQAREATLQSEEPEVAMIKFWPAAKTVEGDLHLMFSRSRVRGEWFRLEEADISEIEAYFEAGGCQ